MKNNKQGSTSSVGTPTDDVVIALDGKKAAEMIEFLFPADSYPELNAKSITIYEDGAIYLDDDTDPFQYLYTNNVKEEIKDLKETFQIRNKSK